MMPKIAKKEELMKKTKKELILIAKKLNLVGIYSLRKAELIKKILGSETNSNITKKNTNKITKKLEAGLTESPSSFNNSSTLSSKKESPKEPSKDKINIPEHYGDTKITLLVKDPDFVFSYWEINENFTRDNNLDKKELILRVYDITNVEFDGENANYFFDIPIILSNSNWYIKVPESNRNYCVDIGYIDEDGRFTLIARSNAVSIPRTSVSENYDEEWMAVEELFKLSGGYKGQAQLSGSMEIEKMITERLKMAISSEAIITSWPLSSSSARKK